MTDSAGKGQATSEPPGCLRRTAGGCWRLIVLVMQLAVIGVLLAILASLGGYVYLSNQLSDAIDRVVAYQGSGPGGTPRFYDRKGNLLFEMNTAEKRRWLTYEELPQEVIAATIAVEDDTFWENPGFDAPAIVAAFISNYRKADAGRPVGASTITQQLVRHAAFTYDERIALSYERKLREIFLAFILTQQRSKEDILTMYLNEIYYGNLAYGIEAAAQTYFAKAASDLTTAEAAFLAGLPQSPVELDPYSNLAAAKGRQELVLDLMEAEGLLTSLDAAVAKGAPIQLASPFSRPEPSASDTLLAPHFVLYVQDYLERQYGPDALTRGGWQITTSLDLDVHRLAEQAVREQVAARAAAHDVNNGAAVVIKPATGEILAMVGSIDYFNEAIDGQVNVTLRPRQPGSSIKPITYAAAMEQGWTTGDVLWDVPIVLDQENGEEFAPRNYSGRFHGPILLRDALANSYNIPPVQLIRDVGIAKVIATARKLGVDSLNETPGFYGLTLTLGGGEVPLLELSHAYATLANGGQRVPFSPVLKITDSRGNVVYDGEQDRLPGANVLDPRIAYILSDILDDDDARAPAMGYNNALNPPFPAAVKTGTTNDFRDNWTVGYTPGVVVGVWLGNTDGHPMIDSSGLRGAAPVWRQIIEGIYAQPATHESLRVDGLLPASEFARPNGIEEREVCMPRGTGGTQCSAKRTDLFLVSGPQHAIPRLGYMPDTHRQPGAWTLTVLPLPADAAQRIQRPPLNDGTEPPPATHCVANSAQPPSGAQTRLLLPVPPYYPDEVRARLWNQRNGSYAMAPATVCPSSLVRAGGNSQDTGNGNALSSAASYRIAWPRSGDVISGLVEIQGTADFSRDEFQFYKLEIGTGTAPTDWLTLGTTHEEPVTNGTLEQLHAYALPPGPYVIRLVLVRNDGNFPNPFAVPITIAAE